MVQVDDLSKHISNRLPITVEAVKNFSTKYGPLFHDLSELGPCQPYLFAVQMELDELLSLDKELDHVKARVGHFKQTASYTCKSGSYPRLTSSKARFHHCH